MALGSLRLPRKTTIGVPDIPKCTVRNDSTTIHHRSLPASDTACTTGDSRYSITRHSPVLISTATLLPG